MSNSYVSQVSLIEVLGFHGLSTEQHLDLDHFLSTFPVVRIDDSIVNQAISLRRKRKMTLGDALIAATAVCEQLTLVSRNAKDFSHVGELNLINPFDKSVQ